MDWYNIDRFLVHRKGLRLAEIEELTLSEIALYLDDPELQKGKGRVMTQADMLAAAIQRQAMSPRDKLEQQRRKRRGQAG